MEEKQISSMELEEVLGIDRKYILHLTSKILGYAVIAASLTLKLPQIFQIHKNKSTKGLSLASFELETIGYTIALAYCIHKDLPFSAFGEYIFLVIQCFLLVTTVCCYSPKLGILIWIKILLYFITAAILFSDHVNSTIFEALYASQHAIFISARLPQIHKNYTNKSTGQLNFLTCLMTVSRSLIRLFTNIQQGSPISMIIGNLLGISSNGTILFQVLRYHNSSQMNKAHEKKKKKKKKRQRRKKSY